MKRIKRFLAITLCVLLSLGTLAGCGKTENTTEFDPDAVILTVGGEEVPLQEAYFMLKWQQSEYQSMASNIYGEEWYNQDMEGNGETFLDYIKTMVETLLEDMYVCRQNADSLNLSITEEEQQAIDKATETFMNSNTEEAQSAMMADEETVRRVLENYTIYSKVYNEVVKDADTSVSEEEGRQKTYSYIYQDLVTTDSEGNQTEYTDEQKQEYYVKFTAVAEAARKSGDFDKAATDAGFSPASHTYSADGSDNDTFADVNSVADKLKVGEVSDLIPVEGGVMLIHLDTDNDEEKTEAARETRAAEKQDEYFENWISPLREQAAPELDEELWGKIGFEKALAAVREEN